MPHVDDQFSGHMFEDDPRGLLFGTHGCTWPTVPAWRYRAQSDNATGLFVELNGDGLLVPFLDETPSAKRVRWEFSGGVGQILEIRFTKVQAPVDEDGFAFICEIDLALPKVSVRRRIHFDLQECNFNALFGNFPGVDPVWGNAGSTFTMNQVVWDETLPPE